MNELTRQIQGIMIPQAALIAYELQNEVYAKESYYLELRPIDGKGRIRAAVPVTYEFMNALTESFSVEMNGIPHGRIPENLLWCDTRKGNERYIWYNPPARRRMFFHRQLNLAGGEFNLPGIIYEAGRERLDVFAFKGEKPEDETELYLAPFLLYLLDFHTLCFHKLTNFRTTVINSPVNDVILDEFLGAVTSQSPVCNVQQLAQIDVIKQFIAIETIFQTVHAVQLLLDPLESFQNRYEHLFYHFAIYIHGVNLLLLNEYLILFFCAH